MIGVTRVVSAASPGLDPCGIVVKLASGVSRAATLRTLGLPTVVNVLDGINAPRRLLARFWIDATRLAPAACRR